MDHDALLAEIARLHRAMHHHAALLERGESREHVAGELRRSAVASRVSVEILDGPVFNPSGD